ncbi:alpha/beta hydrolase family protein [Sedimenticola hydrogenitrophicus]|uniref:alpha/beta hydrolase family protein n=1 Tax=Sedimenticola hydrogenitrophicus TaxID=2967975 RepID=UPI0021A6E0C2|nr:alpha/beta hydrolase family protein [Sedimenticola hydrogenitrophicus]
MRINLMAAAGLLFAVQIWAAPLWASDLAREGRIAAEIQDALLVGEPLTLQAQGVEFFAIQAAEETDYIQGAAIILHGRGAHPDWVDVINPLRSRLPEYGWKTLSIQLPIAASDASGWVYRELIPEAFPRITAAVEHLKRQGVTNIVLIGHSLGARMGVEYLAQGAPAELRAFVAIGLSADNTTPDSGTLGALKKLRLPLLDIYGSRDIDAVLNSVAARSAASRQAKNGAYRQNRIDGADHFFNGLNDTLVAEVRAWLGRVAPGEERRSVR